VRSVLFDHIAIAVPRLAEARAVLGAALGGRFTFGDTTDAYRFWHWRYPGGGDLEVLEPVGADGFLHRFLAQRGPGIHHVTFTVPSLGEACARARSHGYSIVGYDDSDPRWKEAFLHPKQAQGIVVQFAETADAAHASADALEEGGRSDEPAPAAITVLGLRTRARSRERAHTQWGAVVRGEPEEAASGAVVYRWPGSAMRIVVEIDRGADEGPLAIDYTSARPVALPDGPHPVLGAVFRRTAE
jgi:methylmalonyl-CoA/ethylmalonyl-CoA epimerase